MKPWINANIQAVQAASEFLETNAKIMISKIDYGFQVGLLGLKQPQEAN